MIIIDTEKAKHLSELTSVTATFEHVGAFANKELPDKFSTEFTQQVMNAEFQAEYARLFKAADKEKVFDKWDDGPIKFKKFMISHGYNSDQIKVMLKRLEMHDVIGNNEYYLGNGLTKNLAKDGQQYGVVELLNFEHKIVNIAEFQKADAIKILPLK